MKALTFLLLVIVSRETLFAGADDYQFGKPTGVTGQFIDRKGYALSYNEDHEQANWVSYKLTRTEATSKKVKRESSNFNEDPLVTSGSATDDDYEGEGFDRGHLAPAADMRWSTAAMEECFFYSNMSPQVASFNRGVWKRLETWTRSQTVDLSSIHIVVGPILRNNLDVIGANEVSVPDSFYKCILYKSGNTVEAIGFLMTNEKSSEPLDMFAVTIDEVEAVTGLNFYNDLENAVENLAESQFDLEWWFEY